MNCKASSNSNAHNAAGQQKEKIKRQLWPGREIDKERVREWESERVRQREQRRE